MKLAAVLLCTGLFSITACSSSGTNESGPVIDDLQVPETTTTMTVGAQTGPGVTMTLSAHDDDAGMTALHVVFNETGQDLAITLPGSPTSLTGRQVELVVVGAPKGTHALSLYVADAKGHNSASIAKSITVP